MNEGDRAPALTLVASDGTSIALAAPGQPLVLYFYPKDRNGCDSVTILRSRRTLGRF